MPKSTTKHERAAVTTNPIIENFQSPILLSSLAVPLHLDKELVRSVALYGDFDCFRDLVRRLPAYLADNSSKKAARQRRHYLLVIKKTNPQKFQAVCVHYGIPFESPKNLLSDFNTTTTAMMTSYFSPVKKSGKTLTLFYSYYFFNEYSQLSFVFFVNEEPSPAVAVPEFELNLEKGESNVNGFFAFLSPAFVFEGEQIEVVVLHKQVNDIEDVRNLGNSIVVSLLPDGSGVVVEEPSVPAFMTWKGDELYDGCANQEMANTLRATHAVCMTSIESQQGRQKKKYILNFPDNVVCQMGYMNPSTGRILRGHVSVSKTEFSGKAGRIDFTHVTIRYMAVIKTEERKLLRSAEATSNIEELLAGMFFNDTSMER